MAPHVGFSQLLLVALGLLYLLIHAGWPHAPSIAPETSSTPNTRRRKRATDPKPVPGFIHNPLRDAEVGPNTVLRWLVEAAEQLQAFSCHVLHDLRVRQVQMDELFALLSAVRDGETDRKNKRPFTPPPRPRPPQCPPLAATPCPHLLPRAQRRAAAPPERPGARRRATQRGLDMQLRRGEGRAIRGAPKAKASGRAAGKCGGG